MSPVHDDRLAFFRLAFFIAVIFGPMCLPHAVAVWRGRRKGRQP